MKQRMRFFVIAAALSIAGSAGIAQDFNCEIRLLSGEHYANVALMQVGHDTLHFLHNKNLPDWVLVDSLIEIRRERSGAILPAALIGGAGGGALGFALKPVARDQEQADIYSVAFGAVIGSVAGYFVGSKILPDEVFDLQNLDHEAKIEVLGKIAQ